MADNEQGLRILQVVHGYPADFIGGTELYCQVLTGALQGKGHRCFVLAGSNQQGKAPALITTDEEGISVTRYVSPLPPEWRERQIDPYNPEAELLIRRHLDIVRPDVIHVHHWLRLTNTVVSLAAQLGIPAIVTLHDLFVSCARLHRQHKLGHFCRESPSPALCYSCVERYPWQGDEEVRVAIDLRQEQIAEELHLARYILVPSETHREFLSRLLGISSDHLRVVPHGSIVRLSPCTDTERPRFPHRPLRLAYWGHLVDFKGVHLLLQAATQLKDPSAIEIVLAGGAPNPWYLEYLQEQAAGLSVRFMGEYRPEDLVGLDVDMAVFPSLAYESHSFVLDEAFQLGLPVIVSDRGALGARAGEGGLTFSAGDASALADRIQEVLDAPSLLEDMRQKLPSSPSPSMMEHAQALETIYQEAMRITPHPSVVNVSESNRQRPASVLLSAPRRLVHIQSLLAARDQQLLHLKGDLEQRGAVMERQEAIIGQQGETLRQQEEALRQQGETLLAQGEGLRQQGETLLAQEEALRQQEETLLAQGEGLRQQGETLLAQGEGLRQQGETLLAQREKIHQQGAEITRLDVRLQEEVTRSRTLDEWVHTVSNSIGWRFLQRFYSLRRKIAPPGTRRGDLYKLLVRIGMAFFDGGFASAARVLKEAPSQPQPAVIPGPYDLWLAQHALTSERSRQLRYEVKALAYQPMISIIMPVYNTKETWLRQAIDSVRSQIYPNWELCICNDGSATSHVSRILDEYCSRGERIRVVTTSQNRGIAAASNTALSLATGEFVGFVDHDDVLAPDALCEVARLLNERPDLDLIYTDEDKLTIDGRRVEPFFKPDWSPDLLLSMNYITHFAVVRRSIVQEINGFAEGLEGSQDYDLFLRISEKTHRIGHVARPLYSWRKSPDSTAHHAQAKPHAHLSGQQALENHLQRTEIAAEVVDGLTGPFRYRIRYRINGQPLVSIIIPTRDKVELLKCCLKSIEEKTTYRHFEIIVVDNQSEDPETLSYLAGLPHKVVSAPCPFNYSYLNNLGAASARGEYLLFLNNDTEVISEEWLAVMLEHAQRPDVGAVGAKLIYPDGTIQHAGVVLGHGGVAGHAFWYQPASDPGYFDLAQLVRNCSAVTGACMMMRTSVFAEMGGFDENIKVAFNDIDLCLRIREKGYLVIYTPYAVLYHQESASRKHLHPADDQEYVIHRWGKLIEAGDPYYNPHLSLSRFDFSLRILDGPESLGPLGAH